MDNKNVAIVMPNFVEEFIYSFEKAMFIKIARTIDLLEHFGAELKMPHSKKINKDIYELRIRGRQEVRILYCFCNGRAFLLHGFVKKSDKIPKKEVEIAVFRFRDLTK
jgi:phage-related protein